MHIEVNTKSSQEAIIKNKVIRQDVISPNDLLFYACAKET